MTPLNPYIIEGEVIEVQPKIKGDDTVYYKCRVSLHNGALTDVSNVQVSSIFGGVGDYSRRRLRSRKDAEFKQGSFQQKDLNASVGERVLIAFINGNIYNPIIIGFKEHPAEVSELDKPESTKPQSVEQYLGVRETVDEEGNWRWVRKGAPVVKFEAGNLLGSVPSLGGTTFLGDKSPALEPKDESERLVIEVLGKALYRVRDPKGGLIEIDHTGKKGVYISDNDWTSAEDVDKSSNPKSGGYKDPRTTSAEYLCLNRGEESLFLGSRKLTQITSQKDRYDLTIENHKIEVEGNYDLIVVKNYKDKIDGEFESIVEKNRTIQTKGNFKETTLGDSRIEVKGKVDIEVDGDYSLKTKSSLTLYAAKDYNLKTDGNFVIGAAKDIQMVASGNAALNLSNGKVAIGGPTAELLDLFDQTLQQMDTILTNIQALSVLGNLGFPTSTPINIAAFIADQVNVATIKTTLNTIKGSL